MMDGCSIVCGRWFGRSRWFVSNDLIHKRDVSDGQSESFDPGKSFLVGESRDFATEFVEGFVQVEHATSFTYVGRPSLGHCRHSFALLATGSG